MSYVNQEIEETNGQKLVIGSGKKSEKKTEKKTKKKSGKKPRSKVSRSKKVQFDPMNPPIATGQEGYQYQPTRRMKSAPAYRSYPYHRRRTVNQMPFQDWGINIPNPNQLKKHKEPKLTVSMSDLVNNYISATMDKKMGVALKASQPPAELGVTDPYAEVRRRRDTLIQKEREDELLKRQKQEQAKLKGELTDAQINKQIRLLTDKITKALPFKKGVSAKFHKDLREQIDYHAQADPSVSNYTDVIHFLHDSLSNQTELLDRLDNFIGVDMDRYLEGSPPSTQPPRVELAEAAVGQSESDVDLDDVIGAGILNSPQWAVPYWPAVQQTATPETSQMGQRLFSGSQMPLLLYKSMITGGMIDDFNKSVVLPKGPRPIEEDWEVVNDDDDDWAVVSPELDPKRGVDPRIYQAIVNPYVDLSKIARRSKTDDPLSSIGKPRTFKEKKPRKKKQPLGSGIKIHGNYCGPTWTAGKPIAAADTPDSEWDRVAAIDDLDQACKVHDWDCKQDNTRFGDCSQAADQKLINEAYRIAKSSDYPAGLRAKAAAVAAAIKIAQKTLHRKNVTEGEGTVQWIQQMNMKKGAFTRQAKQHNMSVPEFADYVLKHKAKFDDTTRKRAVLAQTLAKVRKGSGISFEDVIKWIGKTGLKLGKSYMKSLEAPMTEKEKRAYGARPGLFD